MMVNLAVPEGISIQPNDLLEAQYIRMNRYKYKLSRIRFFLQSWASHSIFASTRQQFFENVNQKIFIVNQIFRQYQNVKALFMCKTGCLEERSARCRLGSASVRLSGPS